MKYIFIIIILFSLIGCNNAEFYTTTDTELKLDIIPFETDRVIYDESLSDSIYDIFIYIGKVNSKYQSEVNNKNEYYIQLNDDLTNSVDEIFNFINPHHNMSSNYNILIIADKNTPEQLLQKIEYQIAYYSFYKKSQIYYLEKNTKTGSSGFNNQLTRIEHTYTPKFDKKEYVSYVKSFIKDSVKADWIYTHPVNIKQGVPLSKFTDFPLTSIPPPPPSILAYNFDTLNFKNYNIDSINIIPKSDFFIYKKKMKYDSLLSHYGPGIVISLPYTYKGASDTLIDCELIDWGWCGTGKYRTFNYNSNNLH